MLWPLIYLPFSEIKNSTNDATSSGFPNRPAGIFFKIFFLNLFSLIFDFFALIFINFFNLFVSIPPKRIELLVTFDFC